MFVSLNYVTDVCLTELCNRCFSSCKFFSFRYEKYFYGHIIKKRCVEVKWKMRFWMLSEDPNLQQHCSDSLKSHRCTLFPDEQTYLQQAKLKQLTFIHSFTFFFLMENILKPRHTRKLVSFIQSGHTIQTFFIYWNPRSTCTKTTA